LTFPSSSEGALAASKSKSSLPKVTRRRRIPSIDPADSLSNRICPALALSGRRACQQSIHNRSCRGHSQLEMHFNALLLPKLVSGVAYSGTHHTWASVVGVRRVGCGTAVKKISLFAVRSLHAKSQKMSRKTYISHLFSRRRPRKASEILGYLLLAYRAKFSVLTVFIQKKRRATRSEVRRFTDGVGLKSACGLGATSPNQPVAFLRAEELWTAVRQQA
jgi:hypothetical protein